MGYEVTCTCGNVLPISEEMAGYTAFCPCGRTVPVPALAELQRPVTEQPATAEATVPTEHERVAEFYSTLRQLTPRVLVTPALIAINVLIFVLMVGSGVSLMNPTIPDLLRWGADFGPMTTNGQWWRLFTCMFIHIGIIHILLNMWVLAEAGPLVERMLGQGGFLVMYVVAGLIGSVASLLWNPMLISAGASGAIFGVYGALGGLLVTQKGSIPAPALAQLKKSAVAFLGYNLIYGLMQPNVDIAAHLGGLLGGFVCGLVLSQPFTLEARAHRPMRNLAVAGVGAGLVLGGAAGVYAKYQDLAKAQQELEHFQAVEKNSLSVYNAAVQKAQRHELTDAGFADIMERDVLPEWKATCDRLGAFKQLPDRLQRHVGAIVEYMRLRQEAWDLFAQALHQSNQQLAQQAMQKQALADAAAKRITEGAGK